VTFSLLLLITVIVGAISAAAFIVSTGRQRDQVLSRVDGRAASAQLSGRLLVEPTESMSDRLAGWLRERLPASFADDEVTAGKLVHAGYDGDAAPVIYAASRLAFGLLLPTIVFVFAAGTSSRGMLLRVAFAGIIGVLGPPAVLDRLVQRRRERIRFAIPDALDLLVVCVEAGVSLDAAILRVARDMASTHPDLSAEFLMVNRRTNAGIPREKALHGLWTRTGLEELRGLASSMVQCEKWGTSIAKVLRIFAETLRRKRKQAAEKRAAEASLKMLFPLMLFLLPALFVVILGPAVMRIGAAFGG
jgi:tight adherence protein C